MLPENTQAKLIEEIELFIDFSVAEGERGKAKQLVKDYRNDQIGLAVLREFYRVLPEVREEAVEKIFQLQNLQGVLLLVLSTGRHAYTVAASGNDVHILGEYTKDALPKELLTFFGYGNHEQFLKDCHPVDDLEQYGEREGSDLCPACGVAPGEYHLLGCPVEVCPWCRGQLSRCDCRFEQLDIEELESEEQLGEFQEKLEAKGRIVYEAEQKPSYPGTSDGLDTE